MKKQQYAAERYEAIYDQDGQTEYVDAISQKHVKVYREKATFCADILESDVSAVWNAKSEATAAKKAKQAQSQEVIDARNNSTAIRKFIQLLNENLDSGDFGIYLSFREEPKDYKGAYTAITWFIKELRKRYKKAGGELVWAYRWHGTDKNGDPTRQHFHFFFNRVKGVSRDEVEDLWREKYGRANGTRLERDEYGLTGFGFYVNKGRPGTKYQRKWAHSQNMRKPEVIRRTRLPGGVYITKKLMEDMLSGKKDIKTIYERAYKGYIFLDARVRYSQYASGVYLYVRMRKIKRE